MRNVGVHFEIAMRNDCDSDSRCGLACDASARDAKSLAMCFDPNFDPQP